MIGRPTACAAFSMLFGEEDKSAWEEAWSKQEMENRPTIVPKRKVT